MEKTKRKLIKLVITPIIVLVGLLLAMAVMFAPNIIQAIAMEFSFDEYYEHEEYAKYDFVDNNVTVVLTKKATRQFLNYTSADFAEVNAVVVMDLV